MPQQHVERARTTEHHTTYDEEVTAYAGSTATRDVVDNAERTVEEIDALLDEIDEVLEENAAEFVQKFRQIGGE